MIEDLQFALRQMGRSRGFAAAVVLTLALAIGVNTAVFSLLDGFLLRSLPYPQPERLAALMAHQENRNNPGRFENDDSADQNTWQAVRQDVPAVTAAVAGEGFGSTEGVNLQTGTGSGAVKGHVVQYVRSASVSAHYFEVLGIEPMLGRGFTEDEDRPGAGRAAVLSYGLWRTAFHGDRGIEGREILLKGAPYTVVGVLPRGAQMPNPADVWTPLMPDDPHGVCAGNNCLILMRLKRGATWDQVRAQLAHMPPPRNVNLRYEKVWYFPQPVNVYAGSGVREPVQALMLAVGFILLIACANLAGLMLARIHRRKAEMATRLALGATRARILRQLWLENLVLALTGGAVGLAMALVLFPAIERLLPEGMVPVGGLALDGRVLAFTLGASVAASLLFGALPALEARRVDLRQAMGGARTVAGGSGRARQWLIGAEVALTVVLLAAAGLMVRTVVHLETLPAGFDAHGVMTATASLDDARYRDAAKFQSLLRSSRAAMERIPGVESAAVTLSTPYQRGLNDGLTVMDGPRAGYQWGSSLTWVTPGFFATLRIPILSGRAIRESDTARSEPVAVVNEAFGQMFFNNSNPVGRHFSLEGKETYTIVGVVPNLVKRLGMTGGAPLAVEPVFYLSAAQTDQKLVNVANLWFQPSWIVRTRGPVAGLTGEMQRALASVDPGLPFSGFYSMDDLMDQEIETQRIEVWLLGTLAGLALLLSAVGIYALVSNLVVQRTREIGIRIALGSTVGLAMRQMAASGVTAASCGVAAGLGCSFVVLRALRSEIYGVGVYDPVTLTVVPLLLVALAAAASLLPALRIARIDPAETLRAE